MTEETEKTGQKSLNLAKHSVDAREVITYRCPFNQAPELIAEIFKDGSYRTLAVKFFGRDDQGTLLVNIKAEYDLKRPS